SFTGTATDIKSVVVHILNAASEEVSSATATGTGGAWQSGPAAKALADGTYTAFATQASSLKNPDGTSGSVTFTVDTTKPLVTFNPVATPTNDSTPTLTGGAGTAPGDGTTVLVTIHK